MVIPEGSGKQPGRHGRDFDGKIRVPSIGIRKPGVDMNDYFLVAGTPAFPWHHLPKIQWDSAIAVTAAFEFEQ